MTKLFTKVPNEAFTVGAERKLSDKELYLLIYLSTEKNYKGVTTVSYDAMANEINLYDDSKESRLKRKLKIQQSLYKAKAT
ncbi:hypothetical protein Q5O89_16745 [Peribacillus frigoritolerans]|nr:hypothetical protein [Peribacillus frigoritolerans]